MPKNFTGKFWSFSFYFLFFAGAVAVFNYLALYFQGQGLPGTQIGVLMGMMSMIGLFSGPLWSGIADAGRRHRLVLSIAMLGNLIAVFLFPFFNSFWWFFALIIVGSIFAGPIQSMADNATMTMLGDEKELYGRVRIGGTIGWGIAAPIVGAVVAHYGMRYNFSIYSVMFLIALIALQQMHFSPHKSQGSYWSGVRGLLTDRKWMVFLIIVVIAASGNGAINNYLFIYLQKISTSPAWMGWAVTISTAVEVPALFFANRMLKETRRTRVASAGAGIYGAALRTVWLGQCAVGRSDHSTLAVCDVPYSVGGWRFLRGRERARRNGCDGSKHFQQRLHGHRLRRRRILRRRVVAISRRSEYVLDVWLGDVNRGVDLWYASRQSTCKPACIKASVRSATIQKSKSPRFILWLL